MTLAGIDSDYVVAQYEAIRRQAAEFTPVGSQGQGLSLFLTHGMTSWLAGLTALTPSRAKPSTVSHRSSDERPPMMAPCVRSDLTMTLASMVLACRTEVNR